MRIWVGWLVGGFCAFEFAVREGLEELFRLDWTGLDWTGLDCLEGMMMIMI